MWQHRLAEACPMLCNFCSDCPRDDSLVLSSTRGFRCRNQTCNAGTRDVCGLADAGVGELANQRPTIGGASLTDASGTKRLGRSADPGGLRETSRSSSVRIGAASLSTARHEHSSAEPNRPQLMLLGLVRSPGGFHCATIASLNTNYASSSVRGGAPLT